MKRFPLFITAYFLLFISSINAQQVNGKIKSTGDANLHVIRLYTDSFPHVALTFHAETDSGAAVWNLEKKDVRVEENDQRGKITCFRLLSAEKHLQTMLVIDHSGSMKEDSRYWDWYRAINWDTIPFDTIRQYCKPQYSQVTQTTTVTDGESWTSVPCVLIDTFYLARHMPEWPGKTPLWYAQQGAKVFIKTMNSPQDTTGLIGFSDVPDVYLPLAQNNENTISTIDNMNPEGSTALYDAVDQSLTHLVYHRGLRAIVALTDGDDNASHITLKKLIEKAKKMRCPVYVIGLGDVNETALEKLTSETGGELYLTNDATKLEEVFLKISRKLQAVYEVVYESPFLKSSEPTHELQLRFDVDSMYLESQLIDLPLPESVIIHLQKREETQNAFQQNFPLVDSTKAIVENAAVVPVQADDQTPNEFPYEALGITFMALSAGVLVYKKTKRDPKQQQTLKIVSVFPNPSSGPVTINYAASAEITGLRLSVMNDSGKEVYTQLLESNTQAAEIDLGGEASGMYLVQLQSASAVSGAERIVIQR
jgi:Mg-chelatase subunit ChlD